MNEDEKRKLMDHIRSLEYDSEHKPYTTFVAAALTGVLAGRLAHEGSLNDKRIAVDVNDAFDIADAMVWELHGRLYPHHPRLIE